MTVHYEDIDSPDEIETITCADCKEWVGLELLGNTLLCGEAKAYYGGSCWNLKTKEPHTCPYAEDIAGDYETLCNCCDNCQGECAMDI